MWDTTGLYATWADFLERWGAGEQLDPSVLPQLKQEDFAGDSWERLARRLGNAVGARLNLWSQGLNRGTSEARDEFEVGRALASARLGLRTIRALAAHPGMPVELRTALLESVDRQVHQAQQTLESQVEDDRRRGVPRSAVEARLRTLRDNRLTVVTSDGTAEAPPVEAVTPTWAVDPNVTRRRRVVLD
jgi:hypothetical protein